MVNGSPEMQQATKNLSAAKAAEKKAFDEVLESVEAYNKAIAALKAADRDLTYKRHCRAAKQKELRDAENAYWRATDEEVKRLRRESGTPDTLAAKIKDKLLGAID